MLDLFTTGSAEISRCAAGDDPGHDRQECGVCEVYRYELRRVWDVERGLVAWVMLNPSRADAETDDATIRRCVRFARDWGYGGIVVRNLFALRATDPRELRQHPDPVGPDNDRWLATGTQAAITIAAWGTHGGHLGRDRAVRQLLAGHGIVLHQLGLTGQGAPRHPLYLPITAAPAVWPRRIQLRRSAGWRIPANTRHVARPGRFGNPFRATGRTAAEHQVAVDRLRANLRQRAAGQPHELPPGFPTDAEIKRVLAGADLACWCAPAVPCHADLYLTFANGGTW